jgi:apolipoprotein N-acyltransferase
MRLFKTDKNNPGRQILFAGIAAGAVMVIIGLVWTAFDPTGIGPIILGMIVIVPAILSLLTLVLAWVFFLQSGIAGPPSSDFLISVAYFLSPIKRNWRGMWVPRLLWAL